MATMRDVEKTLQSSQPPLYALSADEKRAWGQLGFFCKHGGNSRE
jgi:hypothetical protein